MFDLRDPMVPAVARVIRSRHETADVWTLDLELVDAVWPGFSPGQFNMLSVFGVGEAPISFSGEPTDNAHIVHTVRAVGPVSKALCHLKVGDTVGVRGPFGNAWPMDHARGRDVIVVAGGLGLAPVRPVLYRLMADRRSHGRVTLLYGARNPGEILYRHEIEKWRTRLDIDVEVTVDHATADWRGHVGVVTKLIGRARFDPADAVAIVCGPEVMMRFAAKALADSGIPEKEIYLSMERNMKCGIGLCGHCQLGPLFICRDGPVFTQDRLRTLMATKEL
ncbi:MAG: FAD/NAD(P)-binding protein [Phyllobacteriaceae bacterium]|nr:FAD/NAD(P)-binding protein [Phyllobacteriaceae bacterium]